MSEQGDTPFVDEPVVDEPVLDEATPEGDAEPEVAPEAPAEGELSEEQLDEAKEELKANIKKLNLKVDGKELEREIDLANEEELIKLAQMAEMSQKRAQEAAELRKTQAQRDRELEQFLGTLKSDPEAVLKQMGIDTAEFAEAILNKEVEEMQLTEEEKKIRDLEAKLKEINEREEAAKKEAEEQKSQALRDKFAADYEKDLMSAMESGELPNSPHLISKMVDYMSVAINQGIDVNFNDLIPLIQDERQGDIRKTLEGMSAEELLEIISEKTINDIVLKKMPKEKKKAPPTAESIKDTATPKEEDFGAKKRTGSAKDFFKNLTHQYAGM